MSEWHYLQCESHTPPLVSRDEVCESRDLDEVQRYWADGHAVTPGLQEHHRREISAFRREHPSCRVTLLSEYGTVQPLTAGGDS